MDSSSHARVPLPVAQQDVIDLDREDTPAPVTETERVVIDLEQELNPAVEVPAADVEEVVIDLDREFTLFPELPIELRVKVWEHAFPGRVVNIIYDQYMDQFHSSNTSAPTLLHIHKESREMGLKLYHLCFGTESSAPQIYFDFNKDTLLFDDYLRWRSNPETPADAEETYYKNTLDYLDYPIRAEEEELIQRIAVNSSSYKPPKADKDSKRPEGDGLQQFTRALATKFANLKEFTVTVETVNPYSKAPIRFFNVGSNNCNPICEFCYTAEFCCKSIERLKTVFGKMLKINFVGAYRGSFRFDLGCYGKAVAFHDLDDKPDAYDPKYVADVYIVDETNDHDQKFSYDSDDGEMEEQLDKYLRKDLFEQYEYEDVEMTFSDWGDEEHKAQISAEELADIQKDEQLYRDCVGEKVYISMQDEWVDPGYYDERMEL